MNILGQFGYLEIWANNHKVIYPLNTLSTGINGINQQCLLYYYYMSIIPGTVDKITVRKEEKIGTSTIIDTVTSSPINEWIRRNVTFTSTKIYFDLERTSGAILSQSYIAVDEISILQGNCVVATMTTTTRQTTSVTSRTSITTTKSTSSSTIKLTTVTSTSSTITKTTETQFITSTPEVNTSTGIITTIEKLTTSSTATAISTDTFAATQTTEPMKTALSTEDTSTITVSTMPLDATSITLPRTPETTTTSTTTKTFSVTQINDTSTVSLISLTTTVPIETSTSTSSQTAESTITSHSLTTSTIKTTTFGRIENDGGSYNKTLIIALATSIPAAFILAAVGIVIWMKKSTSTVNGVLGSIADSIINIGQHKKPSLFVELDQINDESIV
ncbi:unnamed protein product [Rotaria sp. Silwood2]|nr:unnamed protein product [Rotaria sp. Silwood2]